MSLLIGTLAATLTGSTSARILDDPIVGFWHYSGGVVQVTGTAPSFTGVVVQQTTLSTCPHPVGEKMWVIVKSGSTYTGTHLGFTNVSTCSPRENHPSQWSVSGDTLSFTASTCTGAIGTCGVDHFTLTRAPAVATKPVWPKMPDALVTLASVSNGCGGGPAGDQWRIGDTSVYRNSNNPFGKRYVVNFREACNVHDAGYSGAKVLDPFAGKVVDFYGWSQARVDLYFLDNMRRICDKAFAGTKATVALADCKSTGGKTSLGAQSRYNFVRDHGARFYRARPSLLGAWTGGGVTVVLKQQLRSVTGTWKSGDTTGELRGTLVSRDQDSVVQGFAQVTANGTTTQTQITITIDPDTPRSISVAGAGLPATLGR